MRVLREQLVRENVALLESTGLVLVFERAIVPADAVAWFGTVLEGGRSASLYRVAKVSHADRLNRNERVNPGAEWSMNVERANRDLIPAGRLVGGVDHQGPLDGGNLNDSPILWRSLILHDDGGVTGEFSIITDHQAGRDLQAQLDACMANCFSTFGYARGREPTPAERIAYQIPADVEHPVVIRDWRLVKIDAVDNPSVHDAWAIQEASGGVHAIATNIAAAMDCDQATASCAETTDRIAALAAHIARHLPVTGHL